MAQTPEGIKGDFKKSEESKIQAYTPVPGGVGPMTIAMLLENSYEVVARR